MERRESALLHRDLGQDQGRAQCVVSGGGDPSAGQGREVLGCGTFQVCCVFSNAIQ